MLLEPPAADADLAGDWDDDLIGAEGITTTRLAPAGKARIGGVVRDVVADAALVGPGAAVRVVEVRDGRIVVRPS